MAARGHRDPYRESALFLLALLARAALQLFAGLVLAGLADLGALRDGFLHSGLAPGRVLGLRAHLVPHAIAALLAAFAFARLAGLLMGGLGLGQALLAGLGVLRLREVEAPFSLGLGSIRGRLGENWGTEREYGGRQQDPEHGMSFRSVGRPGA